MKTISLFLVLIFFAPLALGQESVANSIARKNTVSISYSLVSLDAAGRDAFRDNSRPSKPIIIEGDYGFAAVGYNNSKFSGVFLLSYSCRLVSMFDLTFDIGYEQEWKDWKIYNNPLRITEKVERIHYLHYQLSGTVIHFSKKTIEMFSSLGLGATTIWDNAHSIEPRIESSNRTRLAFQVRILGIKVKCADWWGIDGSIGVGHIGFLRLGVYARW